MTMKSKNAKVDKVLAMDFPILKIILRTMREPIIMIHCVKVRYDKNEITFSKVFLLNCFVVALILNLLLYYEILPNTN